MSFAVWFRSRIEGKRKKGKRKKMEMEKGKTKCIRKKGTEKRKPY